MRAKCSRAQHVAAAGDGDEDVAALGGAQRRHDLEALHARLERAHRVDLAHDHLGAGAAGAHRDALAGEAVAEHHDRAAGEQQVGRAQDAVERRLAGAVVVVEEALGGGLVDGEHGAAEPPLGLERAQAQQAGGRLLRAAEHVAEPLGVALVQEREQVGAVVERDLRPALDQRAHVGGVGVGALAATAVDLGLLGQCGGDVVLRGERVGGGERRLRPARDQRADEVGRLRRDVQAGGHAHARERSLRGEPLADRAQDRHLRVRPFDTGETGRRG